nr:ABC transporter permease subunit [Govania unica]
MAFAVAVCNTMLLAVLCIILSTILGLLVALCRISGDWFLNGLGCGFVEVFRNIPALLQIFLWYFVVLRALPASDDSYQIFGSIFLNNRGLFLPSSSLQTGFVSIMGLALLAIALVFIVVMVLRRHRAPAGSPVKGAGMMGFWLVGFVVWAFYAVEWQAPVMDKFGYRSDWVINPELCAVLLGISFYNSSYVAEVIRAGFRSVPLGQWEAAKSLGFGPLKTMRHVIIPQAMRVILPPMTNCYLNIFKATSLGAAVGYPEIVSVMVGTTNNLVGRPVEIMTLIFCIYSLISLLGVWAMAAMNRRFNSFKPV